MALVLRTIGSARSSVRLAAYSFTAAPLVQAFVDAKKLGVYVAVVVDNRHNLIEDCTGKPRAALNALFNADGAIRPVSAYPMQHPKYIVADEGPCEASSITITHEPRSKSLGFDQRWSRPSQSQLAADRGPWRTGQVPPSADGRLSCRTAVQLHHHGHHASDGPVSIIFML
jgi:PLD-like domain